MVDPERNPNLLRWPSCAPVSGDWGRSGHRRDDGRGGEAELRCLALTFSTALDLWTGPDPNGPYLPAVAEM
jgi:hypothetical protein